MSRAYDGQAMPPFACPTERMNSIGEPGIADQPFVRFFGGVDSARLSDIIYTSVGYRGTRNETKRYFLTAKKPSPRPWLPARQKTE